MKLTEFTSFRAMCVLGLALALCSCDPMYRFEFTKFAIVSDMLAGNPTKVDHITEGDLRTVVGTRDGISVKPVGGRNMNNHISLRVSVTNSTDEPLLLDPADVAMDAPNSPLHLVGRLSGGARCEEPSVSVEPAEKVDGVYIIAPGTEAIVDANFGLYGAAKCWFEIKVKPQSSEDKYCFRFKGVPGGSAF